VAATALGHELGPNGVNEVDGCFLKTIEDFFVNSVSTEIFFHPLHSFRPCGQTHSVATTNRVPYQGQFHVKAGILVAFRRISGIIPNELWRVRSKTSWGHHRRGESPMNIEIYSIFMPNLCISIQFSCVNPCNPRLGMFDNCRELSTNRPFFAKQSQF